MSVAHTERVISLMQKYRTRRASDALRGKLDDRLAAAKLPEHTSETLAAVVETEANDPAGESEIA